MLLDAQAAEEGLEISAWETEDREIAVAILRLVLGHRRMPSDKSACARRHCGTCLNQHLDRVLAAVARKQPITFVLPAFPGKSPNPAKVLGTRPDMAERQSLTFLNALSQRIEELYAPGAQIVLCSDGRVFNDVVGISDAAITSYQHDLAAMLGSLDAQGISTFNLDSVSAGSDFEAMRERLMADHGEPFETVRLAVRTDADANRLYRGITRFLFEDSLHPGRTLSKTALQKDCRRRAYEVIRRSRAWDGMLARHFPDAVRLSIHPQACGSRKIGIHLMETKDEWLTAWHSVAVQVDGRFRLMKRAHAEQLGAQLVFQNGQPSHYVLSEVSEDAW